MTKELGIDNFSASELPGDFWGSQMPLKKELSVWRCLFGALCLELSVWSCLLGAVCLDVSVWTCQFVRLEGAKKCKWGRPLNVFKTLMKPLWIDHFLALRFWGALSVSELAWVHESIFGFFWGAKDTEVQEKVLHLKVPRLEPHPWCLFKADFVHKLKWGPGLDSGLVLYTCCCPQLAPWRGFELNPRGISRGLGSLSWTFAARGVYEVSVSKPPSLWGWNDTQSPAQGTSLTNVILFHLMK